MSPTREEAIAGAGGEVYGAILADPERRAQLLAAREAKSSAGPAAGGQSGRQDPRRKPA